MPMHVKLSKIQRSKLFQFGGSLGFWFDKAVGKSVNKLN